MSVLAPNPTRVLYCRTRSAKPTIEPGNGQLLVGDAVTKLRTLPPSSVDCVITSPPYFLLRNYGHDDQIGLEATVHDWVDQLSAVMAEVARVLKPTGSVYLNLGDSFSRGTRYGAPAKGLLLGPERLLLALSNDGWIVRNKIIWAKPNPMPASVRDRLTCSWEPIYFMVRSPNYFFDLDVAREPHKSRKPTGVNVREGKYESANPTWAGPLAGKNDGLLRARTEGRAGHPLGKNPGDVWQHSTATFNGAHFAVYPDRLIERPMKLSCPERVCRLCGRPWRREIRRDQPGEIRPVCACGAGWRPGIVLDPFMGSGTTAVVAERLGRRWIGVELNPVYAALANDRLHQVRRDVDNCTTAAGADEYSEPHRAAQRSTRQPDLGIGDRHPVNPDPESHAPREQHRREPERRQEGERSDGVEHLVAISHGSEHRSSDRRKQHRPSARQDRPQPQTEVGQLSNQPTIGRGHRRELAQRTEPDGRRVQQNHDQSDRHGGEAQSHNGGVHHPSFDETTDTERRRNVNGGPNA